MTEKRFNLVKCKENRWGIEDNILGEEDKLFFICREGQFETNGLVLLLNQLNDKNEQLKSKNRGLQSELQIFKEDVTHSNLQINKLADENEQLKKGMIGVVDRYIKNVECNPPSSVRTHGKIKKALMNIREDLRDLIEDLE